jgi:hypothetical protein
MADDDGSVYGDHDVAALDDEDMRGWMNGHGADNDDHGNNNAGEDARGPQLEDDEDAEEEGGDAIPENFGEAPPFEIVGRHRGADGKYDTDTNEWNIIVECFTEPAIAGHPASIKQELWAMLYCLLVNMAAHNISENHPRKDVNTYYIALHTEVTLGLENMTLKASCNERILPYLHDALGTTDAEQRKKWPDEFTKYMDKQLNRAPTESWMTRRKKMFDKATKSYKKDMTKAVATTIYVGNLMSQMHTDTKKAVYD